MNKNVKMAIGIIVAIVVLIGCGFFVKGMAEASANKKALEKTLVTVNSEKISQLEFDLLKENSTLSDMKMGDKEMLTRMAVNKALYLDAVKNGATPNDKNVQSMIDAQRDKLLKSGKYATLKKDLKKLHISEKQYWENETKRVREAETKNAYRNKMKADYAESNRILDMNALNTKFKEFYAEYTNEVMVNSEIKFLVELK